MERLTQFGDYVILEDLGEDAAGRCFRAGVTREGCIESFVHLRLFPAGLAAQEDAASALRRAVLIGSPFDHPNLLAPRELGTVENQLFLARDFVGGASLHELLVKCKREMYPLGVDHALFLLSSILAGLEYIHGKKLEGSRVTHTGLSSGTVNVSFEGDVRLTDWELYQGLPADVRNNLLGPLACHLPPEVRAGGEATPQSNVFSVGTILYEILARKAPPAEIGDPAAAAAALKLKSLFSAEAAERVREVIARCLAPDPSARFADVREVRGIFDEIVAQDGVEVSHFNFALFMHTLFRIETEEESEKLDADRGLRVAGAPEPEPARPMVDETEETVTLDHPEELLQAALDDDATVMADSPLAPPPEPARQERPASPEEVIAAISGTTPSPPAPDPAPDQTLIAAPPPRPAPAPPPMAPPSPAPTAPPVPAAPPEPAGTYIPVDESPPPEPPSGSGIGPKHIIVGVIGLVVVLAMVVALVFVFLRGDGEDATAEDAGAVSSERSEVLSDPVEPPPETPAPEDAGKTPAAPPETPDGGGEATAPAEPQTGDEPETPPTPPPSTPAEPAPSPEQAQQQELAAVTDEARRLAQGGKFDAAFAAITALVERYPDLDGTMQPLRAEIQEMENKKIAADRARAKANAEAAAQAEAEAEAEALAELIDSQYAEVQALLQGGDPEGAHAKLQASPELLASDRASELRSRIDEAIAEATPSVKEGDLVDPSMGGVVAPRIASKAEPSYPAIARRQRVSGRVTVNALVDENGNVIDTKVLSASSNPSGNWGFEGAAQKAAKKCKFAPATMEGVKVKMWIAIPFTFVP